MDEQLRNHWTNELRKLFSEDAEFSPLDYSDHYEVTVSWRINTDPERPNKRSKTIRIVVPEEAVDDYQLKSEKVRARDDEKLRQFLKNNLKTFDPNHDTPREMERPEVRWIAGSNVLNS